MDLELIWEAFGREKGGKKVAKKRMKKRGQQVAMPIPKGTARGLRGDFKGIHFRAPGPAGGVGGVTKVTINNNSLSNTPNGLKAWRINY